MKQYQTKLKSIKLPTVCNELGVYKIKIYEEFLIIFIRIFIKLPCLVYDFHDGQS